jgi:proteic killer suppression protein
LIVSFGDRSTETLFHRGKSAEIRRIPPEIRGAATRKLDMLNAARELRDLQAPPANRLEALKANLKGKYSIRINRRWRIVFRWEAGDAYEVSIVDYH